MANPEQLAILKSGVEAWNIWRSEHPHERIDLREANLTKMGLSGANLVRADLRKADLRTNLFDANLFRADLAEANLSGALLARANLSDAVLISVNLSMAGCIRANLNHAALSMAYLNRTLLDEADFTQALMADTVFIDTDLSQVKGLESCRHQGPSSLDHRTLTKSGPLPLSFLRGVGLPDRLIEYLPSLFGEAIQFYACFISYSSKDQAFAERLHADLQNKGVRCWFAPHDLPIGAKTRSAIDEAIREYDKLLLVLSKNSVDSAWVEHEIERGLAKELRTRKTVLFPVRLDDAIKSATSTWARELREDRNIGDFKRWRNHDAYQRTFERVLRNLSAEGAAPAALT